MVFFEQSRSIWSGEKQDQEDASISFHHIELFLQVTKTELIHFQTEIFRSLIECWKIDGNDFIRLIQVKKTRWNFQELKMQME